MLERGTRPKMSGQCRYFEQHAWKREICTNCFKSREEHLGTAENARPSVAKASANLKTDVQKLQSILRARTSCQASGRKNVAFPDSLTEVIGYGGNDFSDNEETSESDDHDNSEQSESSNVDEDIPDSEEDRALGNLTRANTNFNTVTANLTETSSAEVKASKSFASLMLGKVQKDSDGKRKTLLVTVTPFGADDTLPTAKRPSDKKISNSTVTSKTQNDEPTMTGSSSCKPETEKVENASKSAITSSKKNADPKQDLENSVLEKIVDMPLITSSNLISVIQKSDALTGNHDYQSQKTMEKRSTTISRCPAMKKKSDTEKPKVMLQPSNYGTKTDYTVTRISQITGLENVRLERTNGFDGMVDIDENAEKVDDKLETKGREVNKIEVQAAESRIKSSGDLEERTVEGEAGPETSSLKLTFKDSRERAGEPDGKADEEDVSEPPALPRTLPPTRNSRKVEIPLCPDPRSSVSEPRASFLHGENKSKPAVPQKPNTLPTKPATKNLTSGLMASRNQNGGYVLPPPSVKNVTGQTQQIGRPNSNESLPGPKPVTTFQSFKDRPDDHRPMAQKSSNLVVDQANSKPEISRFRYSDNSLLSNDTESSEESKKLERTSSNDSDNSHEDEFRDNLGSDLGAELIRSPNKRRMAPKPPATIIMEDLLPATIFARNPAAMNLKSDAPVVREKEKRERASSCSPKFRKAISETPDPMVPINPEAAPRRTISLSQGSLVGADKNEEKKKSRPRFSLKRLLRMGTRKDVDVTSGGEKSSKHDEIPTTPQPKPRLEIIHPLELDGAAVEVLRHDRIVRTGEDVTDAKIENPPLSPGYQHNAATRPGKPPPPPRNLQLNDEWTRNAESTNKPARPPPPRNDGKLASRTEKPTFAKSWQPASSPSASDSIYANLAAEDVTGEVRSGLAPLKPQRTASMRDQTILQPPLKKRNVPCDITNGNDETNGNDAVRPPKSDSPSSNDSRVYECLSSSPECDSNLELRRSHGGSNRSNCKRKSDSIALEPCGDFKYHQSTFTRSTSLPYCGSETESELYSPYSFYTGDEGPEEDQDWEAKEEDFGINRVRQRRGRSIVHRSLEDNYGAVIVANHEALAQLLERLNQAPLIPANLRSLKGTNALLSDFDEIDTDNVTIMGKKCFCSAVLNEVPVTLCFSLDTAMAVSRKEFSLTPIVEFPDVLPAKISSKFFACRKNVHVYVAIFSHMRVNTIKSFAVEISRDKKMDDWTRESCFVLLQLVSALKKLQARGFEESPKNLANFVLCREDKDTCDRLYSLYGLDIDIDDKDEERASLCQCALVALQELKLGEKLPIIRELLMRERAVTLSQVKSILEFSLWGPSDAPLGVIREREMVLQRWLDLERANVLHALVRTRSPLTVTDEYQLIFLVRTSARMIYEASVLLEEQQQRFDSIRSN